MDPHKPIEARLQALEDHQSLLQLKARYAHAADSKYTPSGQRAEPLAFAEAARRQAAFFADNAVWTGGPFGGDLVGREAIFQGFLQAPWRHAMHYYQSPLIDLHGDQARAQWLLWQIAVDDATGAVMLVCARTQETYQRSPQGWQIARMAFDKLHSICIDPDASALICRIPQPTTVHLPKQAPETP